MASGGVSLVALVTLLHVCIAAAALRAGHIQSAKPAHVAARTETALKPALGLLKVVQDPPAASPAGAPAAPGSPAAPGGPGAPGAPGAPGSALHKGGLKPGDKDSLPGAPGFAVWAPAPAFGGFASPAGPGLGVHSAPAPSAAPAGVPGGAWGDFEIPGYGSPDGETNPKPECDTYCPYDKTCHGSGDCSKCSGYFTYLPSAFSCVEQRPTLAYDMCGMEEDESYPPRNCDTWVVKLDNCIRGCASDKQFFGACMSSMTTCGLGNCKEICDCPDDGDVCKQPCFSNCQMYFACMRDGNGGKSPDANAFLSYNEQCVLRKPPPTQSPMLRDDNTPYNPPVIACGCAKPGSVNQGTGGGI